MKPGVEQNPEIELDLCNGRVFLTLLLSSFALALLVTLSHPHPFDGFWPRFGLVNVFVLWVTVAVAAILCALGRRKGAVSEPRTLWIVFLLILGVVGLVAALVIVVDARFPAVDLLGPNQATGFWFQAIAISVITSGVVLRYLALRARWQQQVRAEASARLEALQARIRPHFLFNALNTIASLVRTRPYDAEQAVLDLADLLRTGLRTDARHTLAEELELVRGYLRIESQRLGERLRIDWQVDDSLPLEQTVPALLIQPLVENAIVHGIARLPDGGTLKLSSGARGGNAWTVRVENPWPGPEVAANGEAEGNRMALDNIRQRLELAYGERAGLETRATSDSFIAEIRVPITGPGA